ASSNAVRTKPTLDEITITSNERGATRKLTGSVLTMSHEFSGLLRTSADLRHGRGSIRRVLHAEVGAPALHAESSTRAPLVPRTRRSSSPGFSGLKHSS